MPHRSIETNECRLAYYLCCVEGRPRELDLNRFPIHVNSYYNMKLEVKRFTVLLLHFVITRACRGQNHEVELQFVDVPEVSGWPFGGRDEKNRNYEWRKNRSMHS